MKTPRVFWTLELHRKNVFVYWRNRTPIATNWKFAENMHRWLFFFCAYIRSIQARNYVDIDERRCQYSMSQILCLISNLHFLWPVTYYVSIKVCILRMCVYIYYGKLRCKIVGSSQHIIYRVVQNEFHAKCHLKFKLFLNYKFEMKQILRTIFFPNLNLWIFLKYIFNSQFSLIFVFICESM